MQVVQENMVCQKDGLVPNVSHHPTSNSLKSLAEVLKVTHTHIYIHIVTYDNKIVNYALKSTAIC